MEDGEAISESGAAAKVTQPSWSRIHNRRFTRMNVDHCASCMQSRSMEIRVDLRFFRGSACGPVIVPVFKTGGRQAILSLVGSTPTRFRHRPFGFICAEVLRRKRSGFRQRASASLTPAMRLKFDSHSLPPSSLRVHLRGGPSQRTLRISAAGFRFAHARYAPQVRLPLASAKYRVIVSPG
jgi:hypothetical protein